MPGSHVLPIWAAELREMTVAKTKDVRFQASLVTAQMSASGAKLPRAGGSWKCRFREEFRTPLGVRKSPKHESAVNMQGLMGISEFGLIVLGVCGGLEAVQDQHARHFVGRSWRAIEGNRSAKSMMKF